MKRWLLLLYISYVLIVAFVCYLRPDPEGFDKYLYEAIVRQRDEPWEKVNAELRRSYSRLQESTMANSTEHMAQIEPFYAVKPLYLAVIGFLYHRFSSASSDRHPSCIGHFCHCYWRNTAFLDAQFSFNCTGCIYPIGDAFGPFRYS